MVAVHEVIAASGECLYRGCDVELACEVYEASPAGTRLRCRREAADDKPIPYRLPTLDEPVPYALTPAGYAATDMFVVDTADADSLRRRCPDLFTRQTGAAATPGRGRSAS